MSYSVVICKVPVGYNFVGDILRELRKYEGVVNEFLGQHFELHGELKHGYTSNYKVDRNTSQGVQPAPASLILCQAAYKYDEIYNSHFFELISKEEFGAITKQLVTEEFVLLRDAVSPTIFDVDEDEEHILLPHGDLILIENEYNELPFIFQQFYKIKKEDLNILRFAPQFINTNQELIAARDRFNASRLRNQLGVNQENRVGGNRRKMNKKIKTNKKRKQRMRKTKHKW